MNILIVGCGKPRHFCREAYYKVRIGTKNDGV